jgi:hypothetical protein
VPDLDLSTDEVSLFSVSEEGRLLFGDVIQVPNDDRLKLAIARECLRRVAKSLNT